MRLYFILHGVDQGKIYPGAIAQSMGLPNSLVTKHLDQLAQRPFGAQHGFGFAPCPRAADGRVSRS